MKRGIVSAFIGAVMVAPLLYRPKAIDWNSLFNSMFVFVGFLLFVAGLIAIGKGRGAGVKESSLEDQRSGTSGRATNQVPTSRRHDAVVRSPYYRFAMIVGLLPSLPLIVVITLSTYCSLLGSNVGFNCMVHGHTFSLEVLAYTGVFGWMLSLPAWAVLVVIGKTLEIP
jgi:hypothetical protein